MSSEGDLLGRELASQNILVGPGFQQPWCEGPWGAYLRGSLTLWTQEVPVLTLRESQSG